MQKKTNKTVNNAISLNNGIVIYSNKNPLIGVFTYYDENQLINMRYVIGSQIKEIEKIDEKKIVISKKLKVIISIVLILLSCIAFIVTNNIGFIAGSLLFIKEGLNYTIEFYYIIKEYKLKKSIIFELGKFHSAEHMVINAYEKLCRIPKYKEVEKASRFSKYCGSMPIINELFFKISYSLVMVSYGSFIININNILKILALNNIEKWQQVVLVCVFMLILVWGYIVLIMIIKKTSILRFMQIFFTNKPTEKEIKLAIEAIKNFEELEKSVNKMNKNYYLFKSANKDSARFEK